MLCAKRDCSTTIAASVNYSLIITAQEREFQQLTLGFLLPLMRLLLPRPNCSFLQSSLWALLAKISHLKIKIVGLLYQHLFPGLLRCHLVVQRALVTAHLAFTYLYKCTPVSTCYKLKLSSLEQGWAEGWKRRASRWRILAPRKSQAV